MQLPNGLRLCSVFCLSSECRLILIDAERSNFFLQYVVGAFSVILAISSSSIVIAVTRAATVQPARVPSTAANLPIQR